MVFCYTVQQNVLDWIELKKEFIDTIHKPRGKTGIFYKGNYSSEIYLYPFILYTSAMQWLMVLVVVFFVFFRLVAFLVVVV